MPNFTIIALCDAPEQAETLAQTLYSHIEAIAQWHVNHPFQSQKLKKTPAPPELELAEKYKIKWEIGHDWLAVEDIEDVSETVTVYEDLVFITSGETIAPPKPFESIIKSLGAKSLVDMDTNRLRVTITATLASPQKIVTALNTYITQNGIAPCPWMVYMDEEKDEEAAKLLVLDKIYCQHLTVLETLDHHPNLIPLRGMPIYQKRYEALLADVFKQLPALDEEDAALLDDMREACAIIPNWDKLPNMPPYPTKISADKDQLLLKNLHFGEIASGLPAMLAWLEAEGATDVSYELGE